MRWYPYALGVASIVAACASRPVLDVPAPADAPAEFAALTGASILIGAGDIASCNSNGDEATAAIIDSVLKADSAAHVDDAVFALGDNAYPDGTERDYQLCFSPSWGDTARRVMKRLRPVPGNHEHTVSGAAPYYDYFGKAAGPSKKGYYSYDLGEWHVVALNSEMLVNSSFSNADRAEQVAWLKEDLKDHPKVCTVAYWHHPRWSTGWHGSDLRIDAFISALYEGGADLVLTGHDHDYERFKPLSPTGVVDTTKGIVQFVVGTGGGGLRNFRSQILPQSAFRVPGTFGVLKLTLGATEWRSAFIATDGRIYDLAGGKCH